MINNLQARLSLLKTDLKKLNKQAQENQNIGTYDEWKDILKSVRHIESFAISRMAILKYIEKQK